jgi:glycosyltransferase involved in cell wall biosynthesis
MVTSKLSLSLIMPAYNEERRLPPTLEIIADWIPQSRFDVELIIVDDGSQDRTAEVAHSFQGRIPNLKFMQVPHVGYMNAIIAGLKASSRPLRATLEADCPVHPKTLEVFADSLSQYDVVMGSRVLKDGTSLVEGKSFFRRVVSGVMTRLYVLLFRGGIHDPQIGFKLFKAEVVERVLPELCLRHDGLKSAEILVKAQAFGYRVKEVPVQYKHDEDSKCVPKGNYRVVVQAATALFELWAKSYVEYKSGQLPVCPVRFGFLLAPFWRLLHFPHPNKVSVSQ